MVSPKTLATLKMLSSSLLSGVLFASLWVGFSSKSVAQRQSSVTYHCGTHNGEPATIANNPRRGEVALIVWRTLRFEQWSPERRCEAVSARFQRMNDDRTLGSILPGKIDGYSVVCAVPEITQNLAVVNCPSEQVLMTLGAIGDSETPDVHGTIRQFLGMSRGTSNEPIINSAALTIYGDGYEGIDINLWLESAPLREP
jgi:hypothetical protein